MAEHGHAHDAAAQAGHHSHGSSRKTYMVIFGLLFVLTVLEVGVAHPSLGITKTPLAISLITLALAKAALVAFYFMHLKQETKALRWTVMLPFAFPALYAVILIAEAIWRLLPA